MRVRDGLVRGRGRRRCPVAERATAEGPAPRLTVVDPPGGTVGSFLDFFALVRASGER